MSVASLPRRAATGVDTGGPLWVPQMRSRKLSAVSLDPR